MSLLSDPELLWLVGGVLALLAVATIITVILRRRPGANPDSPVLANLAARVKAWWIMIAVFLAALATGGVGTVVLFALLSFLALREFLTLTPTRPADHRVLAWVFFVVLPLQYVLVGFGFTGLAFVLIPVWAFMLLPFLAAARGDAEQFLERTAKVQWGLMIAVYFPSHVPLLLKLDLPGAPATQAKLLLVLVITVQLSDVLQYVVGKLCGRRPIAPTISPNKTWEGFLGGAGLATLVGASLAWATPFPWWEMAVLAALLTLLGFGGGLVLSAIKRDRGRKDYGQILPGHGGILDRIDSLVFAAPAFYHLIRYFHVP